MLKLFKKAFWIFCDDVTACPSIADTQAAIAKYCKDSGYSCEFTGDQEVVIQGVVHEISRVRSAFHRGRYVIKCREK